LNIESLSGMFKQRCCVGECLRSLCLCVLTIFTAFTLHMVYTYETADRITNIPVMNLLETLTKLLQFCQTKYDIFAFGFSDTDGGCEKILLSYIYHPLLSVI